MGLVLGALLLSATGCGSKGTVSGTVTYNGSPMNGGTVYLITDKGVKLQGDIGTDGKYSITRIPPGPAKLSVAPATTEDPTNEVATKEGAKKGMMVSKDLVKEKMREARGGAAPNPNATKLPKELAEKFGNPEKSGLALTVKAGGNDFPIKIE